MVQCFLQPSPPDPPLPTAGFKRLNCHSGFFWNISGPLRPSADLLGHRLGKSESRLSGNTFSKDHRDFMDDGETAKQLIIPGKIPTCRHWATLLMCSCVHGFQWTWDGPGNWTEVWYERLYATKIKRKMSREDRQLGKIKQIRTVFADTLSRILRMNWQLLH